MQMWPKLAMALEVRLKALIYRLYSSCPTCLVNNEYIVFYISTFSTLSWPVQECAQGKKKSQMNLGMARASQTCLKTFLWDNAWHIQRYQGMQYLF